MMCSQNVVFSIQNSYTTVWYLHCYSGLSSCHLCCSCPWRGRRGESVSRGPTVSSGSWELICAAVLPLPWQKNRCILIWFPLLDENARSHIEASFLLCL